MSFFVDRIVNYFYSNNGIIPNTDDNNAKGTYPVSLDPVDLLCNDVVLKILSNFTLRQLGIFALVSKNWKAISETKELWMMHTHLINYDFKFKQDSSGYDNLEIKPSNISYENVNITKIKEKLFFQIDMCKQNVKAGDEVLESECFKTFSSRGILFSLDTIIVQSKSLRELIIKSKKDAVILKNAFLSCFLLYRFGFHSMQKLLHFSSMINNYYKSPRIWVFLSKNLLAIGDTKTVSEFLVLKDVINSSEKSFILQLLIKRLSKDGEVAKAVDCLQVFRELIPEKIEKRLMYILLKDARNRQDYGFIETLFDNYCMHYDNASIAFTISDMVKNKNSELAIRFIEKYKSRLNAIELQLNEMKKSVNNFEDLILSEAYKLLRQHEAYESYLSSLEKLSSLSKG